MRRSPLLKIACLVALTVVAAAPAWAQWATPTIDGYIAPGEYGTNNQLNNAGNTGQTWYMTWDDSNLYVGIVNANIYESRSLPAEDAPDLSERFRATDYDSGNV